MTAGVMQHPIHRFPDRFFIENSAGLLFTALTGNNHPVKINGTFRATQQLLRNRPF